MNIVSLIFKLVGYFFSILILLYLLKDLATYITWRKQYRGQGIPFEYVPLIGFPYFLMTKLHMLLEPREKFEKGMFGYIKKGDMMAKFRELAQRRSTDKIVALNGRLPSPFLIIQDPELFLEIQNKDNEVSRRAIPVKLPTDLGFFT